MGDEIAIIGMAARVPGCNDVSEMWRALRLGRECISFFSDEELEEAWRPLAGHPNLVKAAAILDDIDRFDAGFFRMSPREAELTDPQHRLFLECAWTALEDAGHGNAEGFGGPISLYAGSWMSSYALRVRGHVHGPLADFEAWAGNGLDSLTTFTSYKLGLTGESVAVQTVCSTSLVAVHLACQSLLGGQSDMALAGGVSFDARQKVGYLYHEGGLLSPDGHCRPFDEQGRGTVRGSGLGVVVLRRLDDALRDGDPIHAVIKASAINNDGNRKVGFAAPSIVGLTDVAATAHALADVPPESISFIEAHGGATPLGDAIEVEALTQALATPRRGFCALGSLKSNFGDMLQASGVCALIKAVLALKHREIPPTVHFTRPNPRIDFARTPFFVNRELRPWESTEGPRRAAVCGVGIGGTNVHLVLEEAPVPRRSSASARHHLVTLSAQSAGALESLRGNLARWLESQGDLPLGDVAYTLNVGRKAQSHRQAWVVQSVADLLAALRQPAEAPAVESEKPPLQPAPSATSDAHALGLAARAWVEGHGLDWARFYAEGSYRRLSLPTTPFERQRYWLEPREEKALPQGFIPWVGQPL